jgi:regulator of sigma E protease
MNEVLPVLFYGALLLGVLVLVHELGHFLVAKWLGVRVVSFSIGMGPRVFGFQRGGTDYRISALPLGGYVRMAGDTEEAEDRKGAPDEFLSKPWWARALIAAAGPVANLAFALVVNVALFMGGVEGRDFASLVSAVKPGSSAERIGLKPHDRILSLAGRPARTLSQLDYAVAAAKGPGPEQVPLVVERDGAETPLSIPVHDVVSFADGLDWDIGTRTVIGQALIGFPAYAAGLREGDEILSVDGSRVETWPELSAALRSRPDAERTLEIRREGRTFALKVKTTAEGTIGISPPQTLTYRQSFPPGKAIVRGVEQTFWATGQIYAGLWSFISDPVRLHNSIAGPIAIAQVASEQAKGGLQHLVTFASFISLALMVMNLLPIPILDGGHIFFALIEALRRKPLSLRTQNVFQRIGLFMLIGLVVFAFYNDVSRVTQRRQAEADIDKRLRSTAPADTAATAPGP